MWERAHVFIAAGVRREGELLTVESERKKILLGAGHKVRVVYIVLVVVGRSWRISLGFHSPLFEIEFFGVISGGAEPKIEGFRNPVNASPNGLWQGLSGARKLCGGHPHLYLASEAD